MALIDRIADLIRKHGGSPQEIDVPLEAKRIVTGYSNRGLIYESEDLMVRAIRPETPYLLTRRILDHEREFGAQPWVRAQRDLLSRG
jgi:hypothetical protein